MKEKYLVINFHPLVFFYFIGALSIVLSLFLGIFTLYDSIVNMEPLFIRAALALILLFIGSMFILFAMLFDMEQERNIWMFWSRPFFISQTEYFENGVHHHSPRKWHCSLWSVRKHGLKKTPYTYELCTTCENVDNCHKWSPRHNLPCRYYMDFGSYCQFLLQVILYLYYISGYNN